MAGRPGVRIAPNGVFNDMGSPNYREQFLHVAGLRDRYPLAFGRPFISNPNLVERFQHGWPLAEQAEMSSWYSPTGPRGYTDFLCYPAG